MEASNFDLKIYPSEYNKPHFDGRIKTIRHEFQIYTIFGEIFGTQIVYLLCFQL